MTLEELEALLRQYTIPFHLWGKTGGKTLDGLLTEVNTGDSVLDESDGQLVRKIRCAALDVFYRRGMQLQHLKETHQILGGITRQRERKWSLNEKMPPGEEARAGARRALKEELGIEERNSDDVSQYVLIQRLPHVEELQESRSFCGLQTFYVIYKFEVYLSRAVYKPEGYVDTSEAPRETTYFEWT